MSDSAARYVAPKTPGALAAAFFFVTSGALAVFLGVNLAEGNLTVDPWRTALSVVVILAVVAVFVGSIRLAVVVAHDRFAVDELGITRESVYGDLDLPWERIRSVRVVLSVGYTTGSPAPAALLRRSRAVLQLAFVDPFELELGQPALVAQRIRSGVDEGFSHEFPLPPAGIFGSEDPGDFSPGLQAVLLEVAGERYRGATRRKRGTLQ